MEVRALLQGFGFNSQRPCTCGVPQSVKSAHSGVSAAAWRAF